MNRRLEARAGAGGQKPVLCAAGWAEGRREGLAGSFCWITGGVAEISPELRGASLMGGLQAEMSQAHRWAFSFECCWVPSVLEITSSPEQCLKFKADGRSRVGARNIVTHL